jgi:hypothetical protein
MAGHLDRPDTDVFKQIIGIKGTHDGVNISRVNDRV